jgi:hypothetical protein
MQPLNALLNAEIDTKGLRTRLPGYPIITIMPGIDSPTTDPVMAIKESESTKRAAK